MTENDIGRRRFLKKAASLSAAATATAAFGSSLQAGDSSQLQKPKALQFSLAHLTVLGCAPPEMTYIAARAGYDFVSYRIILLGTANEPNYALAENKEMLRQTKTALADTGLKVHDIEVARIADGIDPKSYVPALETAADLGARRVITSIWTPERSRAIDGLGKFCDLAKPLGLSISVEFVTWANIANLQDAISVCRAANRQNCGLLIDALHFNRSRVKLEELDAVPREWLHFGHVCDAPKEIPATNEGLIHTAREERLYPGEGAIDIAAIMNRLPVMPYSLEIPHLARVKELGYAEHAWRCLQTAKKYFAAHPRS
jgi:sugar phosphate isomerase/epimerase